MTVTLDIPEDIERRLDQLAERTGFAKSLFYPELMRMGIADLEDYFDAAAESDRHHRGIGETVGILEARRRLGLDG
jgi:RHH-type rel operon transcriptional repressor/antitoxin RelB